MAEVLWSIVNQALGLVKRGRGAWTSSTIYKLVYGHRQDNCFFLDQGQELPSEMDRHVACSHFFQTR
ncbi:hypothetical protein HispidOSU_003161 [Sigmodon hispidus]